MRPNNKSLEFFWILNTKSMRSVITHNDTEKCNYKGLFQEPQCHYASTCTTVIRMNIQVKDFDDFTHPDSHKIYRVFINSFLFI